MAKAIARKLLLTTSHQLHVASMDVFKTKGFEQLIDSAMRAAYHRAHDLRLSLGE